jgi:hypothetical protein
MCPAFSGIAAITAARADGVIYDISVVTVAFDA